MMSPAGFVSAIREDPRMGSEIKYARSGEVHIAYRVFGDGPRDLVLIPGTLSHAEIFWEFSDSHPSLASSSSTSVARDCPIASASRPSRSASATCGP
jgi:hypothetical protein